MPLSKPRRTLSLESLESRITPTGLELSLPGPLVELTSQVGLTSPTPGPSGLGLGVDAGILSLHGSLGTGEALLSLGLKLDLPLLPSVGLQSNVGSPQGLLFVGVEVGPPALPPVPGVDPGRVLPPVNVTVVTPPALTHLLPPVSTPGAPASGIVPPPVAASPTTPAGVAAVPDIGVTNLEQPTGPGDDSSAPTLHSPTFNDLTFASFSALALQQNAGPSLRAEAGTEDIEEQLFRLRDGKLLEDFGTAMATEDAVVSSANVDASQGEIDNAMSLWLLGVLAGCAAGSAWMTTRREEEADPADANPSLIPLG